MNTTVENTRRIVVGVDGSEESIDALRRAIRMASGSDATVEAVVAWNNPTFYGAMGMTSWSPEEDAVKILADAEALVFPGVMPTWLTGATRQGSAAAVLIRESVGADMLIVGSRGHGGFAGLVMGSVSSACAERAHCPVLIMHEDDAR